MVEPLPRPGAYVLLSAGALRTGAWVGRAYGRGEIDLPEVIDLPGIQATVRRTGAAARDLDIEARATGRHLEMARTSCGSPLVAAALDGFAGFCAQRAGAMESHTRRILTGAQTAAQEYLRGREPMAVRAVPSACRPGRGDGHAHRPRPAVSTSTGHAFHADLDALALAVARLCTHAVRIRRHGREVHRCWQRLRPVFVAPGQDGLATAMSPVRQSAELLADRLDEVAYALRDYLDEGRRLTHAGTRDLRAAERRAAYRIASASGASAPDLGPMTSRPAGGPPKQDSLAGCSAVSEGPEMSAPQASVRRTTR